MFHLIHQIAGLLTRRERWRFAGILAIFIVVALTQVAGVGSVIPFVSLVMDPELAESNRWMNWLYTTLGFRSFQSFVLLVGLLVLAVLVLSNVAMVLTLWLIHRFAWSVQHRISTQLLAGYLSLPYVDAVMRNSAPMARNVLHEASQLSVGVLHPALRSLSSVVTVAFVVGLLVWVNPIAAAVIAGIIGGGYALIYLLVSRRLHFFGDLRMETNAIRFKAVNEAFGAFKAIKVSGMEEFFISSYRRPNWQYARAHVGQAVLTFVPRYALETLVFGGAILLLVFHLWAGGDIQSIVPLATLYIFAAYRMKPALESIYGGLASLRFNTVVVETLHRDLGEVIQQQSNGRHARLHSPAPRRLEREVRLEGVTFTYPGTAEPAVRDVDLCIPRHGSIALVGATGAGKTTLADIILGLLRAQAGRFLIDDVEVTDENVRAWQDLLGYVPQHIYLADDTVAHNIAFGVPDRQVDMEAVQRSARIANLHDFVVGELPLSYDTFVGEQGVRLSGGQRQRVGIARALYHGPEVLVLDEATSALDSVTEQAVLEAIRQAAHTKTLIVIAHRLSTVRDSHVIYLMDSGRIVDSGSYEQLLETSDGFRALAGQRK